MNTPSTNTNTAPPELLETLRGLISQTRQQLLRSVDVAQVQTYWSIGRHIVEFEAFSNCDALRHELSWTHYRLLLRVDSPKARDWYMQEAASQNWSTRLLDGQRLCICRTPAAYQ